MNNMNRDYYIIGIATGRIPIEESIIELTEEDYKIIEEYKKDIAEARAEGRRITFYAPESY
jgi:hypothetical protein